MQLVVSCDYLISPAFCTPDSLPEKVGDLVAIKREMEGGSGRVLIETDSLSKLSSLNYYPCAPLFNSNIPKELMAEFSAKDIARIVCAIASMTINEDYFLPECIAYWRTKEINPTLQGCSHERLQAVSQLVEDVSLAYQFHEKPLSILHHPLSKNISSVKISGEIDNSIPPFDSAPPLIFESQISLFSAYQEFLSQFNSFEMYSEAKNHDQIYDAISLGAKFIAHATGDNKISEFRLGEGFIKSLNDHQCGPTQRFSGTTFDVICHVIAGIQKYPHKPMYADIDKKEQKTKDGKMAWRTHITKGNPALRLMYWTEGDCVELANVGNKKDLEIL